ncbi:MAG TPA: twin-arginine translocase subunit TatC, partial [Algoriphagus sp.]|nr:twin-arginine translocase subunit TatC [Algoriphagus sp.]
MDDSVSIILKAKQTNVALDQYQEEEEGMSFLDHL